MKTQPTVEEWNQYALALCYSLVGAITLRMRAVTLRFVGDYWEVEFFLFEESEIERELIEEIVDDMVVYAMDIEDKVSRNVIKEIRAQIIVHVGPLTLISDFDRRVVFKRMETPPPDPNSMN